MLARQDRGSGFLLVGHTPAEIEQPIEEHVDGGWRKDSQEYCFFTIMTNKRVGTNTWEAINMESFSYFVLTKVDSECLEEDN